MGDAALTAAAKAIAYRLDPHAVVDRAARAAQGPRREHPPGAGHHDLCHRAAAGGPGVSVYAALKRAADRCCDGRSRGQVMADTLVQCVTGRPADQPVPVAVNVVISDQALLGVDRAPAVLAGYGPVPSAVAQKLIREAVEDPRSRARLRRLHAAPSTGRWLPWSPGPGHFRRVWPDFVGLRDVRCRTPYCDAPIRHRDHATPHRRGADDRGQRPWLM